MVDPDAGVAAKGAVHVIPVGIDGVCWINRAEGIQPALIQKSLVGRTTFRKEQSIPQPTLRFGRVSLCRNNIVIPSEHNWTLLGQKFVSIADEPFKPAQFIVELGAGGRIAIGQIEAANSYATN